MIGNILGEMCFLSFIKKSSLLMQAVSLVTLHFAKTPKHVGVPPWQP